MKLKIFLTTVIGSLMLNATVLAQGLDPLENTGLGLDEIKIPIFPVLFTDLSRYNTVLSWITFAGGLLVSGIIIFWIYRIIRSGLKAMSAEGDSEKIGVARKELQAALTGIAFTFLVPIVLSFVGIIFGFGTMFEWPKSFSGCQDTSKYQYYFQALAQEPNEEAADRECNPDLADTDR